MRSYVRYGLSLIALLLLGLAPLGTALGHGEPKITADPTVVAAGGTITVTGSEMEDGLKYTLTLEGVKGSIPLGEATAKGDPEAGFVVQYTIPDETAAGSYTVRAVTEDGDVATADLTVTAPSAEASAGPAMAAMPTAELHELDRSKPASEVLIVMVLIVLSGAGGFVLVRRRV